MVTGNHRHGVVELAVVMVGHGSGPESLRVSRTLLNGDCLVFLLDLLGLLVDGPDVHGPVVVVVGVVGGDVSEGHHRGVVPEGHDAGVVIAREDPLMVVRGGPGVEGLGLGLRGHGHGEEGKSDLKCKRITDMWLSMDLILSLTKHFMLMLALALGGEGLMESRQI